MGKLDFAPKRIQIDKANVTIVIVVSVAAFVTFFSLVSAKSLLSQRSYQAKVIGLREQALGQLEDNITAADKLTQSYQTFISSQQNVIGGSSSGTGEKDGDNARIVLDALPSKYDFPALATSLEKIAKSQGLEIENIAGTDDEVNQYVNTEDPNPTHVEMPFSMTVKGSYPSIQELVKVFERSIRPFQVVELVIEAEDGGNVTLGTESKTYYQPEKGLKFKSEVVK